MLSTPCFQQKHMDYYHNCNFILVSSHPPTHTQSSIDQTLYVKHTHKYNIRVFLGNTIPKYMALEISVFYGQYCFLNTGR